MRNKLMEIMESVFHTWKMYWNGSFYWLLLAAAAAVLLIFGWKHRQGKELAVYQILIAAVFFCPVTAWVIQKCVGALVYWRTLWLFPVVPVIAFAMTLLVKKAESRILKAVLIPVFAAFIVLSGTSVWQAGNYVKTGNRQQVPDTVAEVSRIIGENRTSCDSLVAVDDYIASYIRVYDPTIKMPYGREARGSRSREAKLLYRNIVRPEKSYRRIARRAGALGCEFVAVQLPAENPRKARRTMKRYGYKMVGSADNYGVFQQEK